MKSNQEKCPYYYTKASGIVMCVNGLELDGETPRPCSHPEIDCYFTRKGIIPLPVHEETTSYPLPAVVRG